MMVTSQGMQVPQMVMTSQGMQATPVMITPQGIQAPPLMMTSQGMQTPTMVMATEGMATPPIIVSSQGIQNMPTPIENLEVPKSLQMVQKGQIMMGPPRPPTSHGQGEIQQRAQLGQLRQQGMVMTPRGVPHPRMFHPEGMHLMPRPPGMLPLRGHMPINVGNTPRQQIPIQLSPQDQQIITSQPAQIIPMSMAIQGSIQNQQGMQVLPPGAIINPSSSANVGPIMIPPGSQGKISVPWGWKRLLLSDKIVYFR